MKLELRKGVDVDDSAILPMAHLIIYFLDTHNFEGCISIEQTEIRFAKHVFFTKGKIDYNSHGFVNRDRKIYYVGEKKYKIFDKNKPYYDLFCVIFNAIIRTPIGYITRIAK